ncbi:MAG: ABC transporter permease, partial [Clostridia bacterium]|nr:ABC transporter permease [Clostridia bacterium]
MKTLSRIYNALILLFLYAPIAVLVVFSFNDSKSRSIWNGFSLQWYESLFYNDEIREALGVTLKIAILSALFATVIGVLAAVGIHSLNKKLRRVFLTLNNLPMVNPEIV